MLFGIRLAAPCFETALVRISTAEGRRLPEARGMAIGLCDKLPVNCHGIATTIGLRDKVPVIVDVTKYP